MVKPEETLVKYKVSPQSWQNEGICFYVGMYGKPWRETILKKKSCFLKDKIWFLMKTAVSTLIHQLDILWFVQLFKQKSTLAIKLQDIDLLTECTLNQKCKTGQFYLSFVCMKNFNFRLIRTCGSWTESKTSNEAPEMLFSGSLTWKAKRTKIHKLHLVWDKLELSLFMLMSQTLKRLHIWVETGAILCWVADKANVFIRLSINEVLRGKVCVRGMCLFCFFFFRWTEDKRFNLLLSHYASLTSQ